MGREAKRVPLDFEWPIDKLWKGYVIPQELRGKRCPDCDAGQTHLGWWIQQFSYVISMLASDVHDRRDERPMHTWLKDSARSHGHFEYFIDGVWTHSDDIRDYDSKIRRTAPSRFEVDRPGDDALAFFHGITKRYYEIQRAANDEYSQYYTDDELPPLEKMGSSRGTSSSGTGNGNIQAALIAVLKDAAGVSFTCQRCNGEGVLEEYPGQTAEREAWKEYDPPEGDGWQLWTTITEGSPMTPVFPTAEALARHCADTGVSIFGYDTATFNEWHRLITGETFGHQIAPGIVVI